MLSGSFYDILSFTLDEPVASSQKYMAVVSLRDTHPMYQGHFPGNPVVPGVCQVQMIRELVETAVKQPLILTESDNIKFLSMINPYVNPILEINILISFTSSTQFIVTASIGSGTGLFLKFKGKFESESSCRKY
ncbi:MAG: 3-hydroxyacyl-ACP dehydratase [Bacteroidota bacterium]